MTSPVFRVMNWVRNSMSSGTLCSMSSVSTAEEMRASFSSYLNGTTFTEYRDLREPIIGFSDDGSVAWSVVRVKVAGRTMDDGSERDLDFTCAWITLYRRMEDQYEW
jgi:hypothetical protein